ncbi:unnamed protein product [Ectocarpus fasciculatus]
MNNSGVSASSRVWGAVNGQEVHRIDLDTTEGFGVSFTTYGATLLSVRSADRDGAVQEVTLQYDTLDGVVAGEAYYGSTVGRVCNRIAGASYSVDGEVFSVDANIGPHCLHGGNKGFDKEVWRHEVFHTSDSVGVKFEYDSPDGDCGFPGALAAKVTYSVKRGSERGTGELHTAMEAEHVTDGDDGKKKVPTPVNLTNHAYWNLSGDRKRSVRDHSLMMRCNRYLPLDEDKVPTGEIAGVLGTPFDFTEGASLGAAIDGVGGNPPGVDNCLVRVGASDDGRAGATSGGKNEEDVEGLPLIARLSEAASGRVMEVFGSQPSAQVYTANYLSTDPADRPHARHYAVCLETQQFPAAVNHEGWAGSVMLQPGGKYLERTRHVFTVDGGS